MKASFEKAKSGIRRLAKGERGIALLFTLGMLGLLLALALAFASDALSERKASSAANSQAVANMIARSALERVLGAASWYTQANVSIGSGFYSHTKTGDSNAATFDRLWGLNCSSINPFPSGYSADSGTNWQYVSNGFDVDSPGHELIGRFAYILNYGSGGLLDPSACIDTSANEYGGGQPHSNVFGWEVRRGVNVSEINLMNLNQQTNNTDYLSTSSGTKVSFAANGGQLANGQRWLDFDTMFSSLGITSSTQKANLKNVLQLGSPADPEAFWLGTGSGDRSKDPSKYYHRFNLARGSWNSATNPWGWPTDSTPYTEADGSYSREAFLKMLTTQAVPYQGSADGAGGGITWLANWRDAGEMGSVNACKYQVAANLMDFCGAGYQVTSGAVDASGVPVLVKPGTSPDIFNASLSASARGGWHSTAPEFIGQKKTPRLNEVNVVLEICVTYTQTSSSPNRYRFTYTIVPTFQSAIIDLYGGSRPSASNSGIAFGNNSSSFLKAKISYQCQTSAASTTYSNWEEGYASALPAYTNGWNSGYSVATTSTGASFVHVEEGFSDFNTKVAANLKVQIPTPAILNFNGNNVNYCVIEDPSNLNTVTFNIGNFQAGGSTQKVYFSFQVDDPRMNMKPSNWAGPATLTPATNGNYNNVICMGQRANRNVTYNSAAVRDQEDNLDNYAPAYDSSNNNQHLSQSFIRNGTNPSAYSSEPIGMLSPWELGCIHRGSRWQTLNLCAYRNVDADPYGGGSGYNAGDANILDQVKFTNDTKTFGKVNLNTSSARMLQALFANLFIPNTGNNNDPQDGVSRYFNPSVLNNGQFLTLNQAATWASSFLSYRAAMTDGTLLTRAQMMASSDMQGLICQTFKGPKSINEHILSQFINLCKAEPDQITLVIMAQAIKDIGTPKSAANGLTVYKDWNGSGISNGAGDSDAGMIASGYKDASGVYTGLPTPSAWPGYTISNCRKGVYENGADVITAERKFYVTLYWDSKVSKWRILSLQCLIN